MNTNSKNPSKPTVKDVRDALSKMTTDQQAKVVSKALEGRFRFVLQPGPKLSFRLETLR